jgi:hypothetical protein
MLAGLDDIGFTLAQGERIAGYEREFGAALPWL